MPNAWSKKDERQFDHVKESEQDANHTNRQF